jgi:hypothetical protein
MANMNSSIGVWWTVVKDELLLFISCGFDNCSWPAIKLPGIEVIGASFAVFFELPCGWSGGEA